MTIQPCLGRLLTESVFHTNCELPRSSQLSPSDHAYLRIAAKTKGPTNMDALQQYHRLKSVAERQQAVPAFLEARTHGFERYLKGIGLLYESASRTSP